MPTLLDTSNPQNINQSAIPLKVSKGPLLQPIQPHAIPNYNAYEASQYTPNPTFNVLDQQGRGYMEMENEMSVGQSSVEQWGHGLEKAVANVPLKFLEGMGYAYGFGKWGIKDGFNVQHVDDMINNDFAKFFHNTSKDLDSSLPIYGSFNYNEGNIFQKMGTAKFWANDAMDGLAFLASAYGGSFLGRGFGKMMGFAMGNIGRLSGGAEFAGELALSTEKLSAFGAGTIYNTISEAGFEAKDSYDSVYPEVKKKALEEVTKKYSDAFGNVMVTPEFIEQEAEQLAKDKAGQAAANTFVGNLAILSISNAWEMKAFLGNPLDESKKLWRQVVKGEIKEGEINAWKEAGKGFLTGVATEGLWEEGMQNAVQQYEKKNALGKINESGFTGGYFKEWLKGFSNTEGQASMILGALIGGPFQAGSHFQEAGEREGLISTLSKELERNKQSILSSDKIFQNFVENQKYKKNEDGSIILDEKGEPVLNEEFTKDKAYQIQLDEDYQTEKINALLRGDINAAHIVDQYYRSRKLWNYLANPIYESTDEAFEAFKNHLKTQSEEYQKQVDALKAEKEKKASETAPTEGATATETLLPLGDNVDNQIFEKELFKKDFDKALLEAEKMKQEFDKIQDNVKLGLATGKEEIMQEKVSKALFHEVTKREALRKVLNNPTLSEKAREEVLAMIEESENLTKKLFDKEKRKEFIKAETDRQEEIDKKIDEFHSILKKYKEQPELEKKLSKLEKLKTKSQGILKPIISRFERKKAEEEKQQEVPVEEKKDKPLSLEDKMSEEDKEKVKKLSYEISKYGYQNGHSYLRRISDAYHSDVMIGKKNQYYKELGEEEIRKDKLKDGIDSLMSQLNYIINNPRINPAEDYHHIIKLLRTIGSAISNLTKQYNEDNNYSQTNYTKNDLAYLENIEKQLSYLLFQFEEVLDNKVKDVQKELSQLNTELSTTNSFLRDIVQQLEGFNSNLEFDIDLDIPNLSNEAYSIFGAPLVYISFMNNYFITNEDFEKAKETILQNELDYEDATKLLMDITAQKGFSNPNETEEDTESKKEFIEANIAINFRELSNPEKEKLFNGILEIADLKNLKKEFVKQEEIYLKGFEENKESSKSHMDKNSFLQLWKKDMSEQDEFFESLFIKENPDFYFNVSKIIVENFKKNSKEKNQAELDKIEDVFYYRNRLEELKDLQKILDKPITSKELAKTKKEIDTLVETYENEIIPLAIKNQSNRKVVQENSLIVRDKSYFNQVGLNVEIDLQGQVQLKGGSKKLLELIQKIYGSDLSSMKIASKFNFLIVEKIIKELKDKPKTELEPLFDLIKSLKKEVSEEIRTFENTKGQAVFLGNVSFGHYLENPDALIEKLIYDMAHINDPAMRTYTEKENWFSSPLYNYTKHLSPATLLDELKKKQFSGSVLMPYKQLVDYLELHLEYTALFNLEKNLNTTLDYSPYFKNLREQVETSAFSPTYQQEIALREAYAWWNNPSMILSYLKGVAGTGKTSVFLKYFLAVNNISLDNVILSAHGEAQTKTLGEISDKAVTLILSDLLSKDKTFFDKTNLIVIDEINANDDQTIQNILNKLSVINKDRAADNQLKILFLGDPTQLKTSETAFIDLFSSYANAFKIEYAEKLKVFSPLTVAYRSDVGAINNLANAFRDTNQLIQNRDLQSSSDINDKNVKGAMLASSERTNGLLNDILKRIDIVKEEGTTKAIIVSTREEAEAYLKELESKNIKNVEVLTIEEAQGRTFDETYVDIQKPILQKTKLANNNKSDFEYFFNTVMYTAVSRAKNFVLLYDNSNSFTTSVEQDVADNNKDLLQEKLELKYNMIKYLDFADTLVEPTPEEEENDDEIKDDFEEDDFEEDDPGGEVIIEEPEETKRTILWDYDDTILEIQNPEYNVLTENTILGEKKPADAQKGSEVIFMKSGDGHIYAYLKSPNNPDYYTYLTTIYYKNLRDDVPTEKHLKDSYDKNTETKLINYDKNSLKASSINKKHQIASGKIENARKLRFIYESRANRKSIEKLIEDKGGLHEYLKEILLPLVLEKGSNTKKYGDIVNYKVFIPRKDNEQKGQDPNLLNSITNIEYGHPYLKFDVEKTDKDGKIRIQTFFVKLDSPMLKNTDSVVTPLIEFYNGIKALEQELESAGLGFLKLGTPAFDNLLLAFKKDFKAVEDGKVLSKSTDKVKIDEDGNEVIKYKIIPKDSSVITKEDISNILKDYNLSEENLANVLSTFQKNSKELIPLIFSAKKDKVKTSANGYLNFLQEQVENGLVDKSALDVYAAFVNEKNTSEDPVGKQLMDITMNKLYLNETNIIRSFRAAGYDLNALNENVYETTRELRRQITAHSFVPIIDGEHKGKFFAFDPLIGQVVIVDKIPPRKFVSRSYTNKNGIELIDYSDVKLTKRGGSAQSSFNIISRANRKIKTGPEENDFFDISLSYLVNKGTTDQRSVLFTPSLIKETKYDTNFDKKYYKLLNLAFDNYVNKLKAEGKEYDFNLSYEDEDGNHIQFQYKEQLDKDGKSIWKKPVVGRLRKDVHLQDENALNVMKNFLISVGATMTIEGEQQIITKELLDKLEESSEEKPVTSDILSHVVGPETFDESGTSKSYRKNVDRDYVNDTQDELHGGKRFENNIPLQNAVTTRLKGVENSRVQVRMDMEVTSKTEITKEESVVSEEPKEETPIEERKTLVENGTYFLDKLENGKFTVYDNTEYPQEYIYDSYEDAEKKYNELTNKPLDKEETPVYTTTTFNKDNSIVKEYVQLAKDIVLQSENTSDQSEIDVINKAIDKMFTKSPEMTFEEFANKLAKKYGISKEEFLKEFEGYHLKNKC